MKRISLFLLVAVWSACQRTPDVAPSLTPDQNLTEVAQNELAVNFYSVNLLARTSSDAFSAIGSVSFDVQTFNAYEYGFCVSETDSLPRLSSPQHRRIKAAVTSSGASYVSFDAKISDLKPDRIYYIDPYVILSDGRVLYGRYNQRKRAATGSFSAISFKIPQRPSLQPVQLVPRAPVPTPTVSGNSTPDPHFHEFFTLKDRLYSFYQNGALQLYNATADRWDPMAGLGTSVFGTSPIFFTVNDKFYVHSSPHYWYGADRPLPSMWEYDPAKNQWTDLGKSLGENLFNSYYQLSANGKAYFYASYPYRMLAFDAQQKRSEVVDKTRLLGNAGPKPYQSVVNDVYYNSVWAPAGSEKPGGLIKTQIIQYDLASDQVKDVSVFNTQLGKQYFNNTAFFAVNGTDLLTGYGSSSKLIINAGSVDALGSLLNDELVRYSTREQKITAYYDLSGLPDSRLYRATPVMVGNRLFVFNPVDDKGLLTEVIIR